MFKCKRCGYCCTLRAKVDDEDVHSILKLGYDDFFEEDSDNKFIKMNNNRCYFLDDKNECKIHLHRPKICRKYPFLIPGIKDCDDLKKKIKFK